MSSDTSASWICGGGAKPIAPRGSQIGAIALAGDTTSHTTAKVARAKSVLRSRLLTRVVWTGTPRERKQSRKSAAALGWTEEWAANLRPEARDPRSDGRSVEESKPNGPVRHGASVRLRTLLSCACEMGTFLVTETAPMWMRTEIAGHFDEQVAHQVIDVVDRWRASRVGFTVFCDITGMSDYDVPARERIAVWLRTLSGALLCLHVLVDQRAIAWALKIVTVTSRAPISPYHSRTVFEAAFTKHVGSPARGRG